MEPKKIIVTADDYGMCDSVNNAIVECVNNGTISSFNVIFNMEQNVAKPVLDKDVSIGLHWCITAGKPVSRAEEVSSLLDQNGEFYSPNMFKKRFRKGLISCDEIVLELKNQYQRFYEIFGEPSYWNTHQNSALISIKLFELFAKTAEDLGIKGTRNFQRVYIDIELLSKKARIFEVAKNIFADIYFGKIVKRRFSMPDGRIFTVKVESKLDFDKLVRVIKKSRHKVIEVVVHPATDIKSKYFGTIAEPRLLEYNFLRDKMLVEKLKTNGIEIVDFESLN